MAVPREGVSQNPELQVTGPPRSLTQKLPVHYYRYLFTDVGRILRSTKVARSVSEEKLLRNAAQLACNDGDQKDEQKVRVLEWCMWSDRHGENWESRTPAATWPEFRASHYYKWIGGIYTLNVETPDKANVIQLLLVTTTSPGIRDDSSDFKFVTSLHRLRPSLLSMFMSPAGCYQQSDKLMSRRKLPAKRNTRKGRMPCTGTWETYKRHEEPLGMVEDG
ncbi:hypothetical protein N7468_007617 [Penicillium chermesinum]|uniref:Uncharacterized protein n=1 Tax=Penicillium chermesinum TaxID=63820 RepID=A0A9W9NUD1_9EURO|nr:uncharacterized protein N7468_007617 [Penicillium chermesinum]KAJ5226392.1 hypothetical protein N7468_007617 [Penicillium chermesinum]KAJ6160425.1 hypothetical protein N7470_003821 [Penicillium chermesinum]